MNSRTLLAANILLALVLAYALSLLFDVNAVFRQVSKANLLLLLAAMLFYAGMNFLNALRIEYTLRRRLGVFRIFLKHMSCMLLSDFSPGRAAYSAIVLKLRAVGVKSGSALKALGVLFAADFLVRAALVLAALVLLASVDAKLVLLLALVMVVAAAVLFVAVFRRVAFLEWLIARLPFGQRLLKAYSDGIRHNVSRKAIAVNVCASLLGAFLRGFAWLLVLMALGLGSLNNLPAVIIVSALVTALSFVPVSLAGFGLQEGAGAWLFSLVLGLGVAEAAGFMLLARFVEVSTDVVLGWPELLGNWQRGQ